MASPQKENQQAKSVAGFISGGFSILKSIVIKIAEGQIPWLNVWPIKQIFEFIVSRFFKKAESITIDHATGAVIDSQVEKQTTTAEAKKENLQNAIKTGNQDEIKKAEDEFDKAYEDLVHYDGSHSS